MQPFKQRVLSLAADYSLLILAGLLYALGLNYFIFPAKVILTGTEGISVAVSYFFDQESLFLLLYGIFQAILLTFGFFKVGKRFAFRSLIIVVMVILVLPHLPDHQFAQPEPQNERIMLAIFGGFITGIAKAMALKSRGSTGDEDILGAFLAMKYMKPVGVISIAAAVVSTLTGMTLAYLKTGQMDPVINTLMYTSIYIFISAETLNNFFRKFRLSIVTALTRNHQALGEVLKAAAPHRTYTVEEGLGGYSGEKFFIVKTVVSHEELQDILEAIQESEAKSFIFYHDIEGVAGKYYIKPIG